MAAEVIIHTKRPVKEHLKLKIKKNGLESGLGLGVSSYFNRQTCRQKMFLPDFRVANLWIAKISHLKI